MTRETALAASGRSAVVDVSDEELRRRLTPLEYEVTQCSATEPAFTGRFWNHKGTGGYRCVVCGEELFRSDAKYDSGSGWPSFWKAVDPTKVKETEDRSHGMVRTEICCAKCGAHLGHLFPDGPRPTGLRYCVNSASLSFAEQEGPRARR